MKSRFASNSSNFLSWCFLDAVQVPSFLYSLLKAKYFFGQELPAFPEAMRWLLKKSFVIPLIVLNGTPSGEILLKYKSSSLASAHNFLVSISTEVASGTKRNGEPQPTAST